MANEEQLSILRRGVDIWNKWRDKNPGTKIDLEEADLSGADLVVAYLAEANLHLADLHGADLSYSDLSNANLSNADLSDSDLSYANLVNADFSEADLNNAYLERSQLNKANFHLASLNGANITGVNLNGANLTRARLKGTNIVGADLTEADLSNAYLIASDFCKATVGNTNFEFTDLSKAIGLEEVIHKFPSRISKDTFVRSKGLIPDVFLRGCGLSDWEIETSKLYNPDLTNDEINKILYKIYDVRATQALQISPLFISYSRADDEFADKVGNSLAKKGIRYWRDIHDMKAGRLETQIDLAIRQNPTLLLVLSEHSLSSDWVEHEVRTARGLEKEMERDVLCPVALDDSWKSSRWPKRIMEQITEYNILDFSQWQDDNKFDGMFRKLIDGLGLFYKG